MFRSRREAESTALTHQQTAQLLIPIQELADNCQCPHGLTRFRMKSDLHSEKPTEHARIATRAQLCAKRTAESRLANAATRSVSTCRCDRASSMVDSERAWKRRCERQQEERGRALRACAHPERAGLQPSVAGNHLVARVRPADGRRHGRRHLGKLVQVAVKVPSVDRERRALGLHVSGTSRRAYMRW